MQGNSRPFGEAFSDEHALSVLAVSVALVRQDTVLLVKRGLPPSQGLYAFPGGRVELGETLEAAARRELMEETGLLAGVLVPVETILVEPASADGEIVFELTVFTGPSVGGNPIAASDASEARFCTLAEVSALPVVGSVGEIARRLLADV